MRRAVIAVTALFVVVIVITMLLTDINNKNHQNILEESVKSELTSSCIAARNIVVENLDLFKSIDSLEYINEHRAEWNKVNNRLRTLKDDVGAKYIYALRDFSGEYRFIYDTDEVAAEIFAPYDYDQVHANAMNGLNAAGVMNSVDKWGSYNTGAVPIYDGFNVVGIVAVDFEDHFVQESTSATRTSEIVLVVLLVLSLGVLILVLCLLLHRNKKMQGELYRIANIDAITSLPNRHNLFNTLEKNHNQMLKNKDPYAVLFIDLDNFKRVNDSAGHEAGDDVLKLVANVLRTMLDEEMSDAKEGSMTARIGGDEFLQIVTGISNKDEAAEYAQRLLNAFMASDSLHDYVEKYQLGLSIGVSFFPDQSDDYDELIRIADVAMYTSKSHGKNSFSIYDFSMGKDVEGMEPNVRRRTSTGTEK